jgi:uncharacterized protein (TIGR02266 family)
MSGKDPKERLSDLRAAARVEVDIHVDCRDEKNFLFASIRNMSVLGVFIETRAPMPVGTMLRLDFVIPLSGAAVSARGLVVWTNPYREGEENLNPGMGIRFVELDDTTRDQVVELIRRVAYVDDDDSPKN